MLADRGPGWDAPGRMILGEHPDSPQNNGLVRSPRELTSR